MSFGNSTTRLDLDVPGVRELVGTNRDVGEVGKSRNGAGKSAVMNAIVFSMYGKCIESEFRPDETVNITNKKNMVVSVEFEAKGKLYRVTRGRKPAYVKFENLTDSTDLSLDSMANTTDLIATVIGFSREAFLCAYFSAPAKASFLCLSGPEQRKVIESILSLDVLAARAESLKIMKKGVEVDLKLKAKDLEHGLKNNDNVNTEIVKLTKTSEEFCHNLQLKIDRCNEVLSELSSIDFEKAESVLKEQIDIKTEIEKLRDKKNELSSLHRDYSSQRNSLKELLVMFTKHEDEKRDKLSALDALDSVDIKALSAEIENEESRAARVRRYDDISNKTERLGVRQKEVIETLQELFKKSEALKDGVCHVCGGHYVDQDEVVNVNALIDKYSFEHDNVSEEKAEFLAELNELSELGISREAWGPGVLEEKKSLLKQAEHAAWEAESLKSTPNPFESPLSEATAATPGDSDMDALVDEINAVDERLEALIGGGLLQCQILLGDLGIESESDLRSKRERLAEVETQLSELRSQENPFPPVIESLQGKLVDLEDTTAEYEHLEDVLKAIGHVYRLITDRKSFVRKNILDRYIPFLNNEMLTAALDMGLPHICKAENDLSVNINHLGEQVSYYSLSRGERMRLDVAVSVAVIKLMRMMGNDCNLMLVDESIDGSLDKSGVAGVVKVLTRCTESTLLVTHREEVSNMFKDRVNIVKQNGFSVIK